MSFEQENAKLRGTISVLEDQIKTLQTQFDEAIPSKDDIERIHKEKVLITQENRKLKGEKDEIEKMLRIAQKKCNKQDNIINDLNKKIEQLNKNTIKINKIPDTNNEKILSSENIKLKSILQNKNDSILEFDRKINQYQEQLDLIFATASTHFRFTINDINELIHALSSPCIGQRPQGEVTTPPITVVQSSKRSKIWKEKYKESEFLHNKTEDTLIRKIDEITEDYEKQITVLNSDLADLSDQYNIILEENKTLKTNIDKISLKMSKKKKKTKLAIQQLEAMYEDESKGLNQKLANATQRLNKEMSENENSKSNLRKVQKRIKELTDDKNVLEQEMALLRTKINVLESDLSKANQKLKEKEELNDKVEEENRKINRKNDELSSTINQLEVQLSSKSADVSRSKAECDRLQLQIKQLKKDKDVLESERQTIKVELDNCLEANKISKEAYDKQSTEIIKQRKEISILKQKLCAADQQNEDFEIHYSNIPQELLLMINSIIKSHSNQSTRLDKVIEVLSEWYSEELNTVKKENQKLKEEKCHCDALRKEFIESMNTLFSNLGLNLSDILTNGKTRKLLADKITFYKVENKRLNDEKMNYEAGLREVLAALEVSSPSQAVSTIDGFRCDLRALSRKLGTLLDEKKRMAVMISSREGELLQEIDSLKSENRILEEKLRQAIEAAERFEKSSDEQKKELDALQREYEGHIESVSTSIKCRQNELQRATILFKQQTLENTQKRSKLESEIESLRLSKTKLEKAIRIFHKENTELKAELDKVPFQKIALKRQYEEQIRNDRQSSEESYQMVIDKLRKLNDELEDELSNSKRKIAHLENEKKTNIEQINDLSLKLEQSELQMASNQEEFDRARKGFEAQTQAKIAIIRGEYENKLDIAYQEAHDLRERLISGDIPEFCSAPTD